MTRHRRRTRHAGLGELVLPSNYDAQLVTTQRMLPDGSIGVFVGDYQLTPADLRRLEQWRQDGIAARQREYDIQAAKQALELASQPVAAGLAVTGPGSTPSANVGGALALQYAQAIADPTGRSEVTQAVQQMIRQQTAGMTPGQAANAQPIAAGGGAAYYPATAGFPEVGPVPDGAGGTANSGGSSDIMKLALAALGALALFN